MMRRILVTGSTTGIGFATARRLAAAGCHVVLHGPDLESVETVARRIRVQTPNASVEVVAADLTSMAAVRELAETVHGRCGTLDGLINNAAAVFDRRTTNGDNIEFTLAVNYVAVYLLTRLLLPTIERSTDGRIVVVASEAHRGASLDLDDLQSQHRYERFRAYQRSKLADLLFTFELARRIGVGGVAVNAMHPGTVKTRLFRPRNLLERIAMPMLNVRAVSPERGADTAAWLATSDEASALHGRYVHERRVVQSSDESLDPEISTRLWSATAAMTGLAP